MIKSILFSAALVFLAACNRGHMRSGEPAYVSNPQVNLRDRVAAVYNKLGVVKNGERVEILERDRRFARVRTASGLEGWMEQRYLASQQVYDGFQKLSQQFQNTPVQGLAVTRNETNIHLDPERDAEHLFQLQQGQKVSLLKRAASERNLPGTAPKAAPDGTSAPKPMEDWWLIRDSQGHTGWVLSRLVDVDAPLEIAQYAEGQRIVAYFVLDQVSDGDKKVSQYLVLLTEPKDGLPFDFNQFRVFTWNVRRHRYETAYRERKINGMLPVTVGHENFDKEGNLPVFVIPGTDDNGNPVKRKYKLNTPIVRRVLEPGQEAPAPVAAKPRRRRR